MEQAVRSTCLDVGAAFLAFGAAINSIDIADDIQYFEADRLHPTKCYRPIASEVVSVGAASMLQEDKVGSGTEWMGRRRLVGLQLRQW